MQEAASAASLAELVRALGVTDFNFPDSPVVCGLTERSELVRTVFDKLEVDRIIVNRDQRRVDLRWVEKSDPPRWGTLPVRWERFAFEISEREHGRRMFGRSAPSLPLVPWRNVVVETPSKEVAVIAFGTVYLVPGTEIAEFARRCVDNALRKPSSETGLVACVVLLMIGLYISERKSPNDKESIRKLVRAYDRVADHLLVTRQIEDLFDFGEFCAVLMRANWNTYDPSVWRRRYSDI